MTEINRRSPVYFPFEQSRKRTFAAYTAEDIARIEDFQKKNGIDQFGKSKRLRGLQNIRPGNMKKPSLPVLKCLQRDPDE